MRNRIKHTCKFFDTLPSKGKLISHSLKMVVFSDLVTSNEQKVGGSDTSLLLSLGQKRQYSYQLM